MPFTASATTCATVSSAWTHTKGNIPKRKEMKRKGTNRADPLDYRDIQRFNNV